MVGTRRERKGVNVQKKSEEEAVLQDLREKNDIGDYVEHDVIKHMTFLCMTCKPFSLGSTSEFIGTGFILFDLS